ncbi:hypothetical protein GOODEAATRI_003367 [Goodea atripinnis]|uniref:Uncharacterized protein n=1 Tax=Goodea atripinnis TaxID=208336 RepID=A0ABV0PB45_9TELE
MQPFVFHLIKAPWNWSEFGAQDVFLCGKRREREALTFNPITTTHTNVNINTQTSSQLSLPLSLNLENIIFLRLLTFSLEKQLQGAQTMQGGGKNRQVPHFSHILVCSGVSITHSDYSPLSSFCLVIHI